MRALALVWAVLLVVPTPSLAQGHLGVKAGANIATQDIADSGAPALRSRAGVVAGAFYSVPLGSSLDLQVEGLYSTKGARLKQSGVASTLAIDYFEVPALARLRFGSGHVRYYGAIGPSTAFRARAKLRTAFTGSIEEQDVADQIERIDFGIAAGGGAEIGRLIIDGRYTYGLSDIDKDTASKTTNRAIALTAGFRF